MPPGLAFSRPPCLQQKIDYGMKEKNPLDSTFFFQDWRGAEANRKFTIRRDQVSTLLPSFFMERKVRVYARSAAHVSRVAAAFEAFQRERYSTKDGEGLRQVHSTPVRGGSGGGGGAKRSRDSDAHPHWGGGAGGGGGREPGDHHGDVGRGRLDRKSVV